MRNNDCSNGNCIDTVNFFSESVHTGEKAEKKSGQRLTMPPLPELLPITWLGIPQGDWNDSPPKTFNQESNRGGQNCDPWQNATAPAQSIRLKDGCYYARLMPTSLHSRSKFQYEGTMRIQRVGNTFLASGDLYNKDICDSLPFSPSFSPQSNGVNNIPVFPRKQYAFYIRCLQIQENAKSGGAIFMELDPYRLDHATSVWVQGEALYTELKFSTDMDGVHYWRGDIITISQIVLGHMTLVWISPFLRQAVLEIDRVSSSECPLNNGRGENWRTVFGRAGWDLTVIESDSNVSEPEDRSWSNAELHMKMLKYREKVDLDIQWRYHLMAVEKLDDGAFGIMYDNTIKGVNDIPREGAAIASHVLCPDEMTWGKCRNQRFGELKEPYFRTAVHEIGHAMMLYHPDNPYENHIMQKTVQIAANAMPPVQFPDNINWSFSPRDIRMLCHLPDIAVRPGGICFGAPYDRMPMNVRDEVVEADGLELLVSMQNEVVPFGAPVRVNFTLINRSNKDKIVPGSLSMKTGHISGRVIDPLGSSHSFATIVKYTGEFTHQMIPAGASLSHSVTLLFGVRGPLFPTSGFYRVVIELSWYLDGVRVRVYGGADVIITPTTDDEHARIALQIFSTPETLLALAIGGDHLEDGFRGIQKAINHPVLRPHYNFFEAKRSGQRHFERPPDIEKAFSFFGDDTIMTPTEVIRMTKILRFFAKDTDMEIIKKLSNFLRLKAAKLSVITEVETILAEIQSRESAHN